MSDRIRIQRRKQSADNGSYPQLAKDTSGLRMGTAQASVNHDISRISLRPQARLTVSQPGDLYEQEADRVAQQVMTMGDRASNPIQSEASIEEEEENLQLKALGNTITPLVQREEIPIEEEEEEDLQMKPLDNLPIQREEIPIEEEEEEEEELVQAKSSLQRFDDGGLAASNDVSSKLHSRQGQGTPLADNVRNFMEPRFGVDFSNVKVHTDNEAVQMSREVGAQAFTCGSNVYFGAGKSPGNNELTAHELTHVVQQTSGKQLQRRKTSGSKDASKNQISVSTKFLNSGSGLTQKTLGPNDALTYRTNAVEIQFEANQAVLNHYTNLHPLQWSNPESIWVKKQGDIMTDKWINISQSQGAGADNPLPESIFNKGNTIAYYDSPGIDIGPHLDKSRVFVVQNFTGWMAGQSKQGGSPDERISEVVSWHSIVDLSNFSLFDKSEVPSWQRGNDNRASTGWANTGKPSSIY